MRSKKNFKSPPLWLGNHTTPINRQALNQMVLFWHTSTEEVGMQYLTENQRIKFLSA
jgi:hypothetical protein